MAQGERGDKRDGHGFGRAMRAPVRAVTRMLPRGAAQESPEEDTAAQVSGVVDFALYINGKRQPGERTYAEALAEARDHDRAFVWIGLHEPGVEELAEIAQTFDLHPLAVEDAVKSFQRAKLEHYGDMTFIAVRTIRYVEHAELTSTSEVVETGYVMTFIGERYIITVRHGDACRLASVRAELETKSDLLAQGPWAVFHAVVDRIVDLYLDVAAAAEEDVDDVESAVFARDGGGGDIQRIYHLKREMVEFKRAVFPLQRPLSLLVDGEVGVPVEIRRYIRDVADHLSRVIEQLLAFDDLLNSILQARLAQVSVEQNNDMRKIAAWAAIAAVQTTIAGIYGMNFDFMPETKWKIGYPLILLVMAATGFGLYRMFRRSGWL